MRPSFYVAVFACVLHTYSVGPWFVFDSADPCFDEPVTCYANDPTRSYRFESIIRIALANSGPLQLELIQPLDNKKNPYRDFLDSRGAGLQHVSSWPTPELYDSTRSELLAKGVPIAFEGHMAGVRLCYFDTMSTMGHMLEMADPPKKTKQLFANIARASESWDGKTKWMNEQSMPRDLKQSSLASAISKL